MQMVSSIDNMIFALLHEIQREQVKIFNLANVYKTPAGSNAQHPTLYPGSARYNEVFCEYTILVFLQLWVTGQENSAATYSEHTLHKAVGCFRLRLSVCGIVRTGGVTVRAFKSHITF